MQLLRSQRSRPDWLIYSISSSPCGAPADNLVEAEVDRPLAADEVPQLDRHERVQPQVLQPGARVQLLVVDHGDVGDLLHKDAEHLPVLHGPWSPAVAAAAAAAAAGSSSCHVGSARRHGGGGGGDAVAHGHGVVLVHPREPRGAPVDAVAGGEAEGQAEAVVGAVEGGRRDDGALDEGVDVLLPQREAERAPPAVLVAQRLGDVADVLDEGQAEGAGGEAAGQAAGWPRVPKTPVMELRETKKSRSGRRLCKVQAAATFGAVMFCQSSKVVLLKRASCDEVGAREVRRLPDIAGHGVQTARVGLEQPGHLGTGRAAAAEEEDVAGAVPEEPRRQRAWPRRRAKKKKREEKKKKRKKKEEKEEKKKKPVPESPTASHRVRRRHGDDGLADDAALLQHPQSLGQLRNRDQRQRTQRPEDALLEQLDDAVHGPAPLGRGSPGDVQTHECGVPVEGPHGQTVVGEEVDASDLDEAPAVGDEVPRRLEEGPAERVHDDVHPFPLGRPQDVVAEVRGAAVEDVRQAVGLPEELPPLGRAGRGEDARAHVPRELDADLADGARRRVDEQRLARPQPGQGLEAGDGGVVGRGQRRGLLDGQGRRHARRVVVRDAHEVGEAAFGVRRVEEDAVAGPDGPDVASHAEHLSGALAAGGVPGDRAEEDEHVAEVERRRLDPDEDVVVRQLRLEERRPAEVDGVEVARRRDRQLDRLVLRQRPLLLGDDHARARARAHQLLREDLPGGFHLGEADDVDLSVLEDEVLVPAEQEPSRRVRPVRDQVLDGDPGRCPNRLAPVFEVVVVVVVVKDGPFQQDHHLVRVLVAERPQQPLAQAGLGRGEVRGNPQDAGALDEHALELLEPARRQVLEHAAPEPVDEDAVSASAWNTESRWTGGDDGGDNFDDFNDFNDNRSPTSRDTCSANSRVWVSWSPSSSSPPSQKPQTATRAGR
ncbi:hypothetical protein ColKHC_06426 [Colletotrichum higginsianum]|nr:hypothetical protein ColKHC_06426 [Colletotrichum higginsianum]